MVGEDRIDKLDVIRDVSHWYHILPAVDEWK